MQFVYPEFLYALSLLALPIIIHLFNFKRFKTLYFPDVSFLNQIKQRSQSTSRIKHLLVLFSRMLLISCLVIAFAQPFLATDGMDGKKGKVGVQIYLDNSFSMEADAKGGVGTFEEGKQRAYTIIRSYSASDKFQVLDNSFSADAELWLNKEAAIEKLQSIAIKNDNRKLSEVISRFDEANMDEVEFLDVYLVSDFQKSNFDLDQIDSSKSNINLIVLETSENQNISLQDLIFEKPFHLSEQAEKIQATIVRHGESDKTKVPVKLYLENELKVPLSVDFEREDSVIAELSYQSSTEDEQKGFMSIKDYPINFDDTLYFQYDLKKKIKVLHLYDGEINQNLSTLFREDSLYDYQAVDPNQINYTELEQVSLVILDEVENLSSGTASAFSSFLKNGGDLVYIPSKELNASINTFLKGLNTTQLLDLQEIDIQIGEINEESYLFDGVFESIPKKIDLPSVRSYWMISENNRSIRNDLLTLKNGSPFLREYDLEKGKFYLFTSPLNIETTNFTRHALFVPTLYNIALFSQERRPLYYYLDQPTIEVKDIEAKESPVHIVGNGYDLIPQQEYKNGKLILRINKGIEKAGHYRLERNGELLDWIALNFSRAESDYRLMNTEEIEGFTTASSLKFNTFDDKEESLSTAIKNTKQGQPLWKYFIILALLFMGLEIVFLRILK